MKFGTDINGAKRRNSTEFHREPPAEPNKFLSCPLKFLNIY